MEQNHPPDSVAPLARCPASPFAKRLAGERFCSIIWVNNINRWYYSLGHWAWWIALIFGSLATRVLFETAILAFRAYERLGEIRDALAR